MRSIRHNEPMEKSLAETSLLLRTLGHPVRLKIIAGLARECSCVKDIWECLQLPQAVVSQHLRVMKDNGILEAKRDGARVCYSLKDEMLVELVRVLRIEDCTASVAAETARSR